MTTHHPHVPTEVTFGAAWLGWSATCRLTDGDLTVLSETGRRGMAAPGTPLLELWRDAGLGPYELERLRHLAHHAAPASCNVELGHGSVRVVLTPTADGEVAVGVAEAHDEEGRSSGGSLGWWRSAFADSGQLIWGGLVVDGMIVPSFASEGLRSLFPAETGTGDVPSAWVESIHPQDRAAMLEHLRRCAREARGDACEYRMVGPDGQVTWLRSTIISGTAPDGARQVLGVLVDISADRAAGDRAEALLAVVRDVVVEFAWDATDRWCVRYVSPSAAHILGYADDADAAGRDLPGRIHVEDREQLECALRRLQAGTRAEHVTLRVTGADGEARKLEGTLVHGRDGRGEPHAAGVLSDVTEARRLEARLGRISTAITDVVFEAEIASGDVWRLGYVSPSASALIGRPLPADPAASVVALLDAIHRDDHAVLQDAARRALDSRNPVRTRLRVVRLDGEVRHVRLTLARFSAGDDVTRLAGTMTDFTDQWEAERRAGRISEAVGAILVEGRVMPDGRWRLENAPARMERLIGEALPMDPATRGDAWFAALHPDDRGTAADAVRNSLADGASTSVDVRIVGRDGGVRVVRQLAAPTSRPSDANEFALVITDITDLRSAGDRLQHVLDALDEVVIEAESDREGRWRLVYASPAASRLLGRGLPDDPNARGRALAAAVHRDDVPEAVAVLRRLEQEGGRHTLMVRIERAPGDLRWVRVTLARRDALPGRPVVVGIAVDVSELMLTGQALRQAQRGLHAQFSVRGSVSWEVRRLADGTSDMVRLVGGVEDLVGEPMPDRDVERLQAWTARMYPEDVRALSAIADKVLDSGTPEISLFRLRTARGIRWMQATFNRLDAERVGGTILDVHDALAAEDAIRNAHLGVAGIIEGLGEAVYEIQVWPDGNCRLRYSTPRLWDLLGIDPGQHRQFKRVIRDHVHPDDLPRLDQALKDVLDGMPLSTEYRVVHGDGAVRWLRMSGRPRSGDDSCIVLVGTISDITEERAFAGNHQAQHPPNAPDIAGASLTARQRDVLEHLATGASTDEIAESLSISRTTVANHVAAILRRLGARSRLEAVHIARRSGQLPPGI